MYVSLDHLSCCDPPNITMWCSSVLVNEKSVQGGGLVPVTVGEDQHPERLYIIVRHNNHLRGYTSPLREGGSNTIAR